MPVADRRHGLDVVARLRADAVTDDEVLLAGLLHDAGKGPGVGLWPRVAWSLGEAWGAVGGPPGRAAARLRPGARPDPRPRRAVGRDRGRCRLLASGRVDLIRYQAEPRDPGAGMALKRADEAVT